MNRLESEFRKEFSDEIRRWNGYARNLVANCLMSGLPDMLIVSKFGYIFCCETKVWRNKNAPTSGEQIALLLDGPQINVILNQFWKREAYCPIVAFDMNQMDSHYYDGTNFLTLPTAKLAHRFATARAH